MSTEQAELDVILSLGHRILDRRGSEARCSGLRGTYSNHGQKDTDRAKDSLDRGDARNLLCKTQPFDACVQRGKGAIATARLLGLGSHLEPRGSCEKAVRCKTREH